MAFKSIIVVSLLLLLTAQLNAQAQTSSTAEDPLVTLQIRTGFNYNFGGARSWKIQPEFATVFPAFGDVPINVADQSGFGERQGADSNRPASQGRVDIQWQLDKAEGVVPATQLTTSYLSLQRYLPLSS